MHGGEQGAGGASRHRQRRGWVRLLALSLIATTIGGGAGFDVASPAHAAPGTNSVVQTTSARSGTYDVITGGSAYGPGPNQKVSIFRPIGAPGRRPVAYMLHGGSWVGGSRNVWNAEAWEWASRGWVVINADYSRAVLDGQAGDGRQIEADVVTLVRRYEQLYYADPTRQVILGDSAGGHLATLVGSYLRGHFRAIIAWSPVAIPANAATDGDNPEADLTVQLLGQRAREFWGYSASTTSALKYQAAYGGPSMLLIGSQDEWISWDHQGGALCTAIGSRCTKIVAPGILHGTHIRDADPAIAEQARTYALAAISGQGVTPPPGRPRVTDSSSARGTRQSGAMLKRSS